MPNNTLSEIAKPTVQPKWVSAATFAACFEPPLALSTLRRWTKQSSAPVLIKRCGRRVFFENPKIPETKSLLDGTVAKSLPIQAPFHKRTRASFLPQTRTSIAQLHLFVTAHDIKVRADGDLITVELPSILLGHANGLPAGFKQIAATTWQARVIPASVAGSKALFQKTCRAIGVDSRQVLESKVEVAP